MSTRARLCSYRSVLALITLAGCSPSLGGCFIPEEEFSKTVSELEKQIDALDARLSTEESLSSVMESVEAVRVTTNTLNIRLSPSKKSDRKIVAKAHRDAYLRFHGCGDKECGWYRISYDIGALRFAGFVAGGEYSKRETLFGNDAHSKLNMASVFPNWEQPIRDEISRERIKLVGVQLSGLTEIGVGRETFLDFLAEVVFSEVRVKEIPIDDRTADLVQICTAANVEALLRARVTELGGVPAISLRLEACRSGARLFGRTVPLAVSGL